MHRKLGWLRTALMVFAVGTAATARISLEAITVLILLSYTLPTGILDCSDRIIDLILLCVLPFGSVSSIVRSAFAIADEQHVPMTETWFSTDPDDLTVRLEHQLELVVLEHKVYDHLA
jgi:hypothetical protein